MKIPKKIIEETQNLTGLSLDFDRKADIIDKEVTALEYPMETWLFLDGSISNGCSAYSNWFMWWKSDRYVWSFNKWELAYLGKKKK